MKKLSILLIFLFILPSCGKNDIIDDKSDSTPIDSITIGAYRYTNQNPLEMKSYYNEPVNKLIFDSLYVLNDKMEPVENLAKEMVIENSGYDVNIVLKPNVSFHDDSQFTAHDVYATINYIMTYGGYYANNVRNIADVTVTGNYSLKLSLKRYTPNIKMQLTFPIVCKKDLLNSPDKNSKNFKLNGTGAFKVSSETKGKYLTLIRFSGYHEPYRSKVKEINVNIIPDKLTARSLLSSGTVDVFYSAFYDEGLKTVTKTSSNNVDYITDEYTFIALNYNNPLFKEKSIRKAISMAIYRDKIVSDVYMQHAAPAYVPLLPETWASVTGKTQDTAQAQKFIDDLALSQNKKADLTFRLLCVDDLTKTAVSEHLVTDMKAIGIELVVTKVSKEEFQTLYKSESYDMYLLSTNIGYDMDLYEFLDEKGKFSAPIVFDYRTSLTKLAYLDKKELKIPIYSRLCDEFYEEMPHIPLLFLKNTLITSDKIGTFDSVYPNDLYYTLLKR